jgi:hypothetical protein
MPSGSSIPKPEPTERPIPAGPHVVPDDARSRAGVKAAATLRRHKEERRIDSLTQIRAQIAAGTLVVRQMTPEQREAASEATRKAQARNEARKARRS